MAEEESAGVAARTYPPFTGTDILAPREVGVAAITAVSLAYFAGSSDLGLRRMATRSPTCRECRQHRSCNRATMAR